MTPSRMTPPRLSRLGLVGSMALIGLVGCSADEGGPSNASGGSSAGGAGGGPPVTTACQSVQPGRAPIRRLTRFEYNNAVRDLFGDTSNPADSLPPETIGRIGNVFGNDADLLSVSGNLASSWGSVAEGVAARATGTPEALGKLAPCAAGATPDDACARTVIQNVAQRAYHRDLLPAEIDSFLTLAKATQGTGPFSAGISAVIEAVLQGPEFLYRVELGAPAADAPGLRRPTADEIAARLSFLFWGTLPDEALRNAAKSGALNTREGIKAQAQLMVEDQRARPVVTFFFDNLLPISGLTNLARDKTRFPVYDKVFAAALREETQQFLQHQIFDADSPGTWRSALTADYTYANETLAPFYGMTGVTGQEFRKVPLPDTTKRLGLITQAGIMTGTITTNESNPVLRGSFIINKLMCRNIQLPTDPTILAMVKIPEGVTGATARERFTAHRQQAVCAGCHALIDPVGFSFENFDPIGQWREQENGVTIDASGSVPGVDGSTNGPVELVRKLATAEAVDTCFAQHWMEFGYGKTLGAEDACVQSQVNSAFLASGGNIKQLLVGLTQSDAFLYMPAKD